MLSAGTRPSILVLTYIPPTANITTNTHIIMVPITAPFILVSILLEAQFRCHVSGVDISQKKPRKHNPTAVCQPTSLNIPENEYTYPTSSNDLPEGKMLNSEIAAMIAMTMQIN